MKKLLSLLFVVFSCGAAFASTNPVSFNAFGTTWVLPLQKVQAVQLYSVSDKKGYPGAETVLAAWGSMDNYGNRKASLSFGASPVLGTSQNVPFASLKFRLPARLFDTTNNSIMFGAFVGKESNKPHATYGVSASIQLW